MKTNKFIQYSLVLVILYSLFSVGCENPFESEKIYSFEMYYLNDQDLIYSDLKGQSLSNLKLQKNPFLTAEDIDVYSVRYIENNPIISADILLKKSIDANLSKEVRPFVIVVNRKRYSLAEYWPAIMAVFPKSIIMYRETEKKFHLHPGDEIGNNKMQDPYIAIVLKNLGVEINYINIGNRD